MRVAPLLLSAVYGQLLRNEAPFPRVVVRAQDNENDTTNDMNLENGAKPVEAWDELNATSSQILCYRISDAISFAQSCSQLRGVLRVLPSPTFEPAIVDLLGALDELARELRLLFAGESDIPQALQVLEGWPRRHNDALQVRLDWTSLCSADVKARYEKYLNLAQEHSAAERRRADLARHIARWREVHAAAGGSAASNDTRDGVLWRVLDTELINWNVLRTKVAHELAWTTSLGVQDPETVAEAEGELAALSQQLSSELKAQKKRAKAMRTLLKELLGECSAGVSDKGWLQSRRVEEEYVHFLASAPERVQDVVSLARALLHPVLGKHKAKLPAQWVGKKPRWAAWWQWVQEPRTPDGKPLSFADFEKAFKKADQEFASKMTSRDPLLLAMLWASVLEAENPPEVLAIGR
jgi:hypothetical protein